MSSEIRVAWNLLSCLLAAFLVACVSVAIAFLASPSGQPDIVVELESLDVETRSRAASRVGMWGHIPANLLGPLSKLLSDDSPEVRVYAAVALVRAHEHGTASRAEATQGAQVLLEEIKRDRYSSPGKTALIALGRLPSIQDLTVPALENVMNSSRPSWQVDAIDSLIGLGRTPAQSQYDILIAATTNDDDIVRANACRSLGKAGVGSKLILDALQRASEDEHEFVRAEARRALDNIARTKRRSVASQK